MKYILWIILSILAIYLCYAGIRFYRTVLVSKKIITATVPYKKESTDPSVPILVLGDSTAFGVGADSPETSLAGWVSSYLLATSVENYSKSGAVVSDLNGQIQRAHQSHYRLILIQIGGNNIIRFQSAKRAAIELDTALKLLPSADKVVVISAGDVGGATLFPFFMRPFYTHLNLQYHAAFRVVCAQNNVTYVNLYESPSTALIKEQPKKYLAADGLHPSSAGYALWFDAIKSSL